MKVPRAYTRTKKLMPKAMKYAKDHDWIFVPGKSHNKLVKGKHKVSLSRTPSDNKTDMNKLNQLRNIDAGLTQGNNGGSHV